MLKTEKWLQFMATNPGWQSNSYLCSYIVARVNSFLSLQIVTLYKLCCNEKSYSVLKSLFGRIRCIAPKYDRIFWGVSKAPWQWFIDPTHVGPMNQKIFLFTHHIFSHFLKLNPTDFLYVVRGRDVYYSC